MSLSSPASLSLNPPPSHEAVNGRVGGGGKQIAEVTSSLEKETTTTILTTTKLKASGSTTKAKTAAATTFSKHSTVTNSSDDMEAHDIPHLAPASPRPAAKRLASSSDVLSDVTPPHIRQYSSSIASIGDGPVLTGLEAEQTGDHSSSIGFFFKELLFWLFSLLILLFSVSIILGGVWAVCTNAIVPVELCTVSVDLFILLLIPWLVLNHRLCAGNDDVHNPTTTTTAALANQVGYHLLIYPVAQESQVNKHNKSREGHLPDQQPATSTANRKKQLEQQDEKEDRDDDGENHSRKDRLVFIFLGSIFAGYAFFFFRYYTSFPFATSMTMTEEGDDA